MKRKYKNIEIIIWLILLSNYTAGIYFIHLLIGNSYLVRFLLAITTISFILRYMRI